MKAFLKHSGFTLVELMVVVAIIGVLSAIAVPNFKKYQSKSKTTEAKLQLAAAYTAQRSFDAEYDTFHICLKQMGFNPTNEAPARHFTVGFGDLAMSDCPQCTTIATTRGVQIAAEGCWEGTGNSWFGAGKRLGGLLPLGNFTVGNSGVGISVDTFTVGAMGMIDDNFTTVTTASLFTINHLKLLMMNRSGY